VAAEAGGINAHYGRQGLDEAILAGLRAAGKDPDRLSPDDLAPADQFHIRGKEATLELARLAGLQAGQRVLDVGGGVGGPARTLAQELGCRVTVLDLTEEFCRVGTMLTERTGLADQVTFRHGTALDMPFEADSFDAAWTQHSTMNIADKERLYAEVRRVLRPGGRLAMHEIMAGPLQPVHFPVPWAPDPSISFLQPPEAIRGLVGRSGLAELSWQDVTGPSLDWFRERIAALDAAQASGPPPLGLHLLLGPLFGPAFRNVLRNLEEQRLAVIQGVFART
jgi:SAM-dependent methyltransferase